MYLYEVMDKKYLRPIPECKSKLQGWDNLLIKENGESLVSLKGLSDKIIVSPQYYINKIDGAEDDCKVRATVASKLIKIANKLPNNFKLLIWDSFRSIETQEALFYKYNNIFGKITKLKGNELLKYTKKFVALPSIDKNKPSPHNTGGAIDLTICYCNKKPIDLGVNFDDFREEAYTRFYEEKLENGKKLTKKEKEILLNRRVLCNLFEEENFVNYPYEIWHKSFGDQMACKISGQNYAIYGGIENQ